MVSFCEGDLPQPTANRITQKRAANLAIVCNCTTPQVRKDRGRGDSRLTLLQPTVTRVGRGPRGVGAETGWARRSRCIWWSWRISWARWARVWRTSRRSPMKHAQRRPTESVIAAKPCPVIFAIGIQPFLRQSYSNPPTSVHFVCFQTDSGLRAGRRAAAAAQVTPCRHREGRQLVTPKTAEIPSVTRSEERRVGTAS